MTTCKHCGRVIVKEDGAWIDPEATGDDVVWRETCDAHDTFTAEHEPACEWGMTNGFVDCGGDIEIIDGHAYCDAHADGIASDGRPAWLDAELRRLRDEEANERDRSTTLAELTDTFAHGDVTVTVLRASEPWKCTITGIEGIKFWCRREDTREEGWMPFGHGGVVGSAP